MMPGPSVFIMTPAVCQVSPRRNKMLVLGPAKLMAWAKVANAASSEVPVLLSEPSTET